MWKKSISVVLSLVMIFLPSVAAAQEIENLEGQIVPIEKNDPSPFTGILLDTIAAAKVTADKKYSLLKSKLELDLKLSQQAAEFQLKLDSLQASFDGMKTKTDSLILLRDEEIVRLQNLVKENPNDYTSWWFAGGFAIGVAISIGIFFAAVEASK